MSALPSGMSNLPSGSGSNDDPAAQAEAEQQKKLEKEREDEAKRGLMSQVLETEARERLSRISLTRPQLSQQIQELLLRMARSGQIREKISDQELKRLLVQVDNQNAPGGGVPTPKSSTGVPAAGAGAGGGRTRVIGAGITIQRKGQESDSDEYDL